MTTYIELGGGGGGGSPYFGDPVPTFASLPVSGLLGELRITLDTGVLYYWDGAAWNVSETEVATVGHTDTDSIDLSTPGSILTADLNISSDAATAGYLKATTSVKSGAGKGLHVEIPIADTSTTGAISDTDWNTFNDKEPAITATTAADYWRGDKTFQALNIDALGVLTSGAINNGTKILGIEYAETPVAVDCAASGDWGEVISVSLTAGTWLCYGVFSLVQNSSVLTDYFSFGIDKNSDGSTIGNFDYTSHVFMASSSIDPKLPVSQVILGGNAPFTAYLVSNVNYSSGQPKNAGKLICMRIR